MCSVFIGVSDREESHGTIRRLKEKKRNDDDLKNYKEWLKRAGKLSLHVTRINSPLILSKTSLQTIFLSCGDIVHITLF